MSNITGDTPRSTLDESAWRTLCETAAAQAMKGSGLSHDYYVERFSSAIDAQVGRLPEDQRAQALQIAQKWDYATPAARQEAQDWNAENGYCSHGIELGCCPAGCDSYDDLDWAS
ncbi:hypothetical protein [Xanthomonas translucens]|uniref:Plasmid-related protein n=1 Tax=Xanthomonas translucens pv. translucens DSM 18974 TaxID=1261556 RepID=A0A1C3TNF5_XANCT|nr:hypothetical protein [Xanthomonas translucens]MCC8445507.1 hypothetical protein [Xanthomonas translucens pv. translucens]UNT99961.1 hypothetical protein KBQ49_04640 [Xanthomonas translucens pv. translucens]CCP38539.1 hypothetical protein BN444_00257 [Xanthomonas translucens pv. translucens DSM 18974]SCB04761.1 conserved hypothetical protein [Xanthomonas translucens pv. translucens DSM 18974]